jgi:hypothetical protein
MSFCSSNGNVVDVAASLCKLADAQTFLSINSMLAFVALK